MPRPMPRRRRVGSCPAVEGLEARLALSAAVNANGVLVIIGSPEADAIVIEAGIQTGTAILTGVPGVPDGTVFSGFEHVRVDLKSGSDVFTQSGQLTNGLGFASNLTVLGGNGNDTISVAQDNALVSINGGNASDTVNGGPGNETLRGGRGIDSIFGNAGHDELHGGLGRDLLVGGIGNDILNGGNQADEMWGNSGNDVMNGGLHRDILWGGGDLDQLTGGPASDTFNGAPDEALDFGSQDVNFNALFNPSLGGVLPPIMFWDRAAEGEAANTGRLDLATQEVVADILNAYAAETDSLQAFFETWLTFGAPQRQSFSQALQVVTTAFSPDIFANPSSFTPRVLEGLRDDLGAAAAAADPVLADPYDQWLNQYVGRLLAEPFEEHVNLLPAGAAGTHGVLFALDSIFNLQGDL